MTVYTDVFKKPLTRGDVRIATILVVTYNSASPSMLQRNMKIGYGKAASLIRLLADAGVVSDVIGAQPRAVILKSQDMAINAALRQLKKGRS